MEKNPYTVDIENVEILEAERIPVLRKVVLKMGGKDVSPAAGRPVNKDPSPICLPKKLPEEIVEKNPYIVEIEATEMLLATIKFVLIVFTERPDSTVVPAVCVILLPNVAVCATPRVVVFEVA